MGVKNGPSLFQRLMQWVLRHCNNVNVYIGDIIIGSQGDTEAELVANHTREVGAVLEALRTAKISLKGAKSKMFVREVQFCGHILANGTRRAVPSKMCSVDKKTPENVKTTT